MVQPKESTAYEQQLVALGRVLQTLREESDIGVLVETALAYLRTEFDYTLVWIGLYNRLEHRIYGKGGSTPEGEVALLKQQFVLSPGDILEQVVIQQRLLGIADLQEETRAGEWRQAAKRFKIQGTMLFPIRHKERCLGVALLGSRFWGVSPRSGEKARLSIVLGALAEALYQVEMDWQRQQTKRPDEPLLQLLDQLRNLKELSDHLELVVDATHLFVKPSRTNVYWFEREQRYFWRRIGHQKSSKPLAGINPAEQPVSGIMVQEVSGFYKALAADQLVAIGEAQSSLKADTTSRLMQQIRARSLLAAPILFQNELMGFLAVEGNEARIWSEDEKRYVRGAAQLIALTAPLSEMEATIQQVKLDQSLTSEITRSICDESDWKLTLKSCAEQLSRRLNAERFLVLLYDADHKQFEVCYQAQPNNRRAIATTLSALNEVDQRMLEKSTEPVGIENLEDDLKLMAWRESLLEAGVRSLLVCNTAIGHALEGLIIVAHENSRTWNRAERDVVKAVAQQIGVILHQWQLQRQALQQQELYQTVQWGLDTLQKNHRLDQLEQTALQQVTQILQVPLVALVTWQPGRQAAKASVALIKNKDFNIDTDWVIPVHSDAIINWAIQSEGLLPLQVGSLPAETRQWLNGPEIGSLLVTALRTAPTHEPCSVLIVADQSGREWPDRHLEALRSLVNQFAWSRRHLLLSEMLVAQREELERVNWYKQRFLEEMYRSLSGGLQRLNQLGQQTANGAPDMMRYQQVLRQLNSMVAKILPILKHEQWQLRTDYETIPLASLLKRLMERADPMIRKRQLWTQVHNDQNLSIGGDILKIEFVLFELFSDACRRSAPGGRIDIWCRPLDQRWLEISITDNGVIEPRLVTELHEGRPEDLLMPSTLDQPPGLHLTICQSLMQQIGGEFNLFKLEDDRILSRIMLPIATGMPADQARISGPITEIFSSNPTTAIDG